MIVNGSRQWLAPILLSTDQEGEDHGKVPDHARVPLPELVRALRTVVYFHSKLINELTVLDEQKGLVFRNASEEGRKAPRSPHFVSSGCLGDIIFATLKTERSFEMRSSTRFSSLVRVKQLRSIHIHAQTWTKASTLFLDPGNCRE